LYQGLITVSLLSRVFPSVYVLCCPHGCIKLSYLGQIFVCIDS